MRLVGWVAEDSDRGRIRSVFATGPRKVVQRFEVYIAEPIKCRDVFAVEHLEHDVSRESCRELNNRRRRHRVTHWRGLRADQRRKPQGNSCYSSDLEEVIDEELQEGQRVSYSEEDGSRGPIDENVECV